MPRKALDSRILDLITTNIALNHRSFLVLIGDRKKAHDQIVNLHYLLTQKRETSRPNVLFCYKKDLGFQTNRKVRQDKIKRDVKRGIRDANDLDPFELFVSVTDIRYCYYKDTEKVLGQTFGMLVLQDFEAITPNLLARTIETVQGGGLIVLILQGMTSLRQLYTMTMDVHSRYRGGDNSNKGDPIARFNERFILSLGSCNSCLVVDDELNVLPLSGRSAAASKRSPSTIADAGSDLETTTPSDGNDNGGGENDAATKELSSIKESLKDTGPIGPIISLSKTVDQAKAILMFSESIADKRLSTTVTLTAARGRGKSAALGLALALAINHGYSNIYVTSPSVENLKTMWEFLFKGFDGLGYKEHLHYDAVVATAAAGNNEDKEWKGSVVRVNVFREHRQTIQYIRPSDSHVLGQAELVVIDEAAAIPLPLVKSLLGPYLVFMASTVNGYEGTGRSLSLKLIQQLRQSSVGGMATGGGGVNGAGSTGSLSRRALREITLSDPIRYGKGDSVEKWLNSLLCLDATTSTMFPSSSTSQGCPHPSTCDLYYVERDTLFSFHPASEAFLQRMVGLYVASHYKNTPNDLQLMSDAPSHCLFVLLPPLKDDDRLPEPLAVIQVALEGQISKQSVLSSLSRGTQPAGDLIPWTLVQQFQDNDFAKLSGARIIRIATHPNYLQMGYGSKAIQLLEQFYRGELISPNEELPVNDQGFESFTDAVAKLSKGTNLQTESVGPRDPKKMPPLLHRLSDRRPEKLDYLGVSYGLTGQLFKFWKRGGYVPLYLRQTPNDLTGEHTCIMLSLVDKSSQADRAWLDAFATDFQRRFLALLAYGFRELSSITALSILDSAPRPQVTTSSSSFQDISSSISTFDLKRLDSYSNNLLEHHAVLDLIPEVARLFFLRRFSSDFTLTGVQSTILLAVGLQKKDVDVVTNELNIPINQLLALMQKTIRKLAIHIRELYQTESSKTGSKNLDTPTRFAHILPSTIPQSQTETSINKEKEVEKPPINHERHDDSSEDEAMADGKHTEDATTKDDQPVPMVGDVMKMPAVDKSELKKKRKKSHSHNDKDKKSHKKHKQK